MLLAEWHIKIASLFHDIEHHEAEAMLLSGVMVTEEERMAWRVVRGEVLSPEDERLAKQLFGQDSSSDSETEDLDLDLDLDLHPSQKRVFKPLVSFILISHSF